MQALRLILGSAIAITGVCIVYVLIERWQWRRLGERLRDSRRRRR